MKHANRFVKRIILMSCVFLPLLILAGCGGSGKVNAPFENSYCSGKDLDAIMSELQEAGFTNIQTEAQESSMSVNANQVISVKIGSNTMYNTANSWKSDVPIVIKYYEFSGDTETVPTPEPESAPEPASEPSGEVVYTADVDSIRQLAEDKFQFDYDNLEVSYDDFDEAFVVAYLPANPPLDETTYIYQNINRYINFCRIAYTIDGLERIRFDVSVEMMDQYGNEAVIDGLSVIMTREYFEKFNWDNLAYLGIWDSFVDNCYYIGWPPQFSDKIDTSKVFYDPPRNDGSIR